MNEEDWKQVLGKIYSNLIDTLIINKRRQNRHKSSNKDYALPSDVIDLASEVGRQVFVANVEASGVDLTQVVPIDVTQADAR